MENTLLVGYSRQVITPKHRVRITGYGDDERRFCEGIADDLCTTCIAVTSGEDTILLFTSDLLGTNQVVAGWLRETICQPTGVPADRIFTSATHSHNAPPTLDNAPDVVEFRKGFLAGALKAAQEALADRAPAKLFSGVKELPNMNYIRHYLMEDGTYSGSNFGNMKLKSVAHATETDPRMLVLQFRREEKPDIVMMNWQAHNDTVRETGYYLLSAGYVGHIRSKFEEDTGMHFAFFQGASGNQTKATRFEEEKHNLNWIEYGHRLAKEAQSLLPDLQPVKGTRIKTNHVILDININHDWDHLINEANQVYDLWKSVGKPEGDALGKTYGFTSVYQARDIRTRYKMEKTMQVELNAFSIGQLGFAHSYNEVFSTVGRYVRANAPFDQVFWVTGNSRYLPCKEAYDYRSYEADTSMYARGTAEKIQEKLVEMLQNLK